MSQSGISVIFLPTLNCNAACEYCFEQKSSATISLDEFSIILEKLLIYLRQEKLEELKIYWQGGEILTMSPSWFEKAFEIIKRLSANYQINIINELQTNLIGYNRNWNQIIAEMFDNQLGSSLDYPNLHRKTPGGSIHEFNALWLSRYREAKKHGICVGVISLPNSESFKIGAKAYYDYYTKFIGLTGFQVNSPFPGGPAKHGKDKFRLELQTYTQFCIDLIDIWLEKGLDSGIGVSPFEGILHYFRTGSCSRLLCGMQPDCSRSFFAIDPKGNVSQCDCWVSSYPEYRFGNIFSDSMNDIMNSVARERFRTRPIDVVTATDCVSCDYLAACHGGCAIRAFSISGDLNAKDPYCEAYKAIFKRLEQAATEIASKEYTRTISS